MSDFSRLALLEAENKRLQSELDRVLELVGKLQQQRDDLYWEYEKIRYSINEQAAPGAVRSDGRQGGFGCKIP